jgi:hypothetical protein
MSISKFLSLQCGSILLVTSSLVLIAHPAQAVEIVISGNNSLFVSNIGNFAAIGGSGIATNTTSLNVLRLSNDNLTSASFSLGQLRNFLTATPNAIASTRSLVFGLGINQSGGGAGFLNLSSLSMSFLRPASLGGGTLTYSLSPNTLRVDQYNTGGANRAEARIQVDLPFDFISANYTPAELNNTSGFTISSQSTNSSGGDDIFFLGKEYTASPVIVKLFEVEGRAGAAGFRDYEFAIGPLGANQQNTGQIYQDWTNNTAVRWCLQWVPSTKRATFFLAGSASACTGTPPSGAISYTSPVNITNPPLDFFTLTATSKNVASGLVSAGTTMNIRVDTINGTTLGSPYSQTATAGGLEFTQLSSPLFNPGITSMSGTATMNWGSGINPNQASARSRVDFKIIAYDPPVRSSSVGTFDTPVSTPEPSALLGLVGILGLGWRGKKRKAD